MLYIHDIFDRLAIQFPYYALHDVNKDEDGSIIAYAAIESDHHISEIIRHATIAGSLACVYQLDIAKRYYLVTQLHLHKLNMSCNLTKLRIVAYYRETEKQFMKVCIYVFDEVTRERIAILDVAYYAIKTDMFNISPGVNFDGKSCYSQPICLLDVNGEEFKLAILPSLCAGHFKDRPHLPIDVLIANLIYYLQHHVHIQPITEIVVSQHKLIASGNVVKCCHKQVGERHTITCMHGGAVCARIVVYQSVSKL